MVDRTRQKQREVAKERAKHRLAAHKEKFTTYWLVFTPKSGDPNPDLLSGRNPWVVEMVGNPDTYPNAIPSAISEFEARFKVKSWEEVAVSFKVTSAYLP